MRIFGAYFCTFLRAFLERKGANGILVFNVPQGSMMHNELEDINSTGEESMAESYFESRHLCTEQ